MALINCPECGKEISDRFGTCVNCGYRIKEHSPENTSIDVKKGKESSLSVAACILAIFPFTAIVGAVLGIVDLSKQDKARKHKGSWFAIIWALVIVFLAFKGNESKTQKPSKTPALISQQVEHNDNVDADLTDNGIKEVRIEQAEVYNENGLSIRIESIQIGQTKTKIPFLLYNSSDEDYSVAPHSYSINSLMAGENKYGFGSVDVPTGKNAKLTIEVENDWLSENGIDEIKKIDVIFWTYADGYKAFDTGVLSAQTDLYDIEEVFIPNGDEIYSDDIASLYKIDDYTFVLFNKSDYDAGYTVENASINDWSYELTDYTYDLYDQSIHRNSYAVFTFPIEKEFLTENYFENVENIEFNVLLEDDYWNFKGSKWEHRTDKIKIEY